MSGLRPYQVDAIERVRACMWQGARRVILVMPTGSGKTRTAGEVARETVSFGRRVLWLAHRAELIDQAADALAALGLTVGAICSGASTPRNPFAPVQVASVQSLLALVAAGGELPPADLIVGDEAHHFAEAAEAWARLLRMYPNALILGPTATPQRGDGTSLEGEWDAIVVGATVAELTELGHLVPCEIERPGKPLKPGQIARNPVDAYVERAPGQRACLFARSVMLADQYAAEFRLRGIEARSISADTPWGERRATLEAFRRGAVRVLTNCYVLTEGFDAPELSCVIVARGCGSAGMWLQMIGRALRTCGRCRACLARNRGEGTARCTEKTGAIVLDLRGVSHEHGRPDDEREYSLDGKGIRLCDPNTYCPSCGMLKARGETCAHCPYEPAGAGESSALEPDKVTGDALVRFARKRVESAAERFETLVRWMTDLRDNGYKPGWLYGKWRAVYGVPLSSAEYWRAYRQVTGQKSGQAAHLPECRCRACRAAPAASEST